MHPSSLFIIFTLFGLSLAAPVPEPTPLALSELLAKAKGDPTVLLHEMAPLAKQLTELLTSMESSVPAVSSDAPASTGPAPAGTEPKPVDANKPDAAATTTTTAAAASASTPAPAPAPAPADPSAAAAAAAAPSPAPADPSAAATAAVAPAPPSPAPADPNAKTADATTAAATGNTPPAAPGTPDPNAAAAAAGAAPGPVVHRRDVAHTQQAHNPAIDQLKSADLRSLRTIVKDLSVINQAIEKIYLDAGKSIDDMPSANTAEGTGWGLINGLTFGIEKLVSLSKDI